MKAELHENKLVYFCGKCKRQVGGDGIIHVDLKQARARRRAWKECDDSHPFLERCITWGSKYSSPDVDRGSWRVHHSQCAPEIELGGSPDAKGLTGGYKLGRLYLDGRRDCIE
ncbi:hypothetical protein [Actinomadura sediminis]|uniref:Uncharacterized protein n=1 Tax=Actinomadura sediminis TaxID=1038904 RepID=A0ABW3EN23_9ACTN